MKIAILGCGPAGLIAANTALIADPTTEVRIISKKEKSKIGGAQYLHEPIPGFCPGVPDGLIDFAKAGDAEGYAEKVYGDPDVKTSWEAHQGTVKAWSLRDVYDRMWEAFASEIVDRTIGPDAVEQMAESYDLVFNSIPKAALCYKNHDFPCQKISITPESPVSGMDNFVMYNGRPSEDWYRTSCIFGEPWTEYSEARTGGPVAGASQGFKPTANNCDCHPDVIPIGRYGRWQRGVLLHHVQMRVSQAVEHAL
jgi:hypothetical protein